VRERVGVLCVRESERVSVCLRQREREREDLRREPHGHREVAHVDAPRLLGGLHARESLLNV